ncbi:MAG: hypothetical protein U0527_00030 [Candidatus Eisenbacteria bacterium]
MFRRRPREEKLSIFYAGDVHGSRVCWKKFVNAASHYPADALIMGGDLTGKALVPIVREGDGSYTAEVIGERREARTAEELDQMQAAIATNGMYPLIVDTEEARQIADDTGKRAAAFEQALLDELRLWVELADERLAETDKRAYVIPGNDDPWSIERGARLGHERRRLRRAGADGRPARDDLLRVRQPDPMAHAARARRGGDLRSPRGPHRPAREPRVGDLQHPRAAARLDLDTAYEVDEELRYVTKGDGRMRSPPAARPSARSSRRRSRCSASTVISTRARA